jgi:hypothetical protein
MFLEVTICSIKYRMLTGGRRKFMLQNVVKHLSDDSLTSQNTVILDVNGVRTSTHRSIDRVWLREWIY